MNELQIFNSEEFGEIRTVSINDEPWFVASDICKALELSNATVSVQRLDEDEKSKFNLGLSGGDTNCVNEYGLYSLVLASRKPEAKKFKRWITHEVIPSIRKHGIYATDNVIDDILNNPDFGIEKNEVWKAVDGYEGKYIVSNLVRVKSLNYKRTGKSHLLSQTRGNKGYLYVTLSKNGKHKIFFVHRLVAEAFIPNKEDLPTVNHIDECRTNNKADNLEWLSYKDNNLYGNHYKNVSETQLNDPKKSKKILQYDLFGNLIKEWASAQEVQRQLKINNSNIIQNCRGNVKSAGGFVWKYAV